MTLDETKGTQDSSQTGDTSGDTKGTSEKEPETFTREQVEAEKQKVVSDALSVAGRDAKSFEKREAAIKISEEKMVQREREKYEAALEDARDDPDKLTAIQTRHKEATRKAELDKRERELDEKEEKQTEASKEVDKVKMERNALGIAQKHDVDVESLKKFTDGSIEAMEDLAKVLPKKGEAKTLKVDSSRTIGGGDWRDLSPDDKLRKGLS